MSTLPAPSSPPNTEANIKSILEWLTVANGRVDAKDADQLHRQLLLLRATPVPNAQRIRLLDMLYGHAMRIVIAELPKLRQVSLPVSRRLRLRIKLILELLATLTQDYFNTLAELFDPEGSNAAHPLQISLYRAMHTIACQIRIYHLIAAPTAIGIWQQLHTALHNARKLGLENLPGPHGEASIQRIYLNVLLAAIAQPASFSSAELEFIANYIELSPLTLELLETPPRDCNGIFWIGLDKDFPAHALIRRAPPPDTPILYFSPAKMAQRAAQQHSELAKGIPASALGLPSFAETHAGKGVLRRLASLWGHPAKRKFPRRRQSYRADLCIGLDKLWQLIKTPDANVDTSEWMVTNESPDGYSLMHMSGNTESLRIGEIVALQSQRERTDTPQEWHICIIRWAISENPEHVELGLQLIAPRAIAAEIIRPQDLASGSIAALILPQTPPLRPSELLVVPVGMLKENTGRIIVLVENDNLKICEVHTTSLDEQTGIIEAFSVVTDDSA